MKKLFLALLSCMTMSAFAQIDVASNGYVAVGSSGPQTNLNLTTGTFQVGLNTDSNWSQLQSNRLVFNRASVSYIDFANNSNSLEFRRGSSLTPVMHMTSTGFVGIGLTNPSSELHVLGVMQVDGTIRTNSGEGFQLFGDTSYFGQDNDGIIFQMEDTNNFNGSTDGGFVFRGFTTQDSTADEWMVVRSQGRVGIGTSNPQQALSIQRDINVGYSTTDEAEFGSTSDIMALYNHGNSVSDLYTSLYFRNNGTNGNAAGRIILGNQTSGSGFFAFHLRDDDHVANTQEKMRLTSEGNLGIGTTDTFGYRLAVNGDLGVDGDVDISATSTDGLGFNWPDYVFEDDYNLLSVEEVEQHINEKGHLPNIPSAKEVEEKGSFSLGEMNKKLLEKVEELMLYTIQQEKRIKALEEELKKSKQ
jgi:hypothetical protein